MGLLDLISRGTAGPLERASDQGGWGYTPWPGLVEQSLEVPYVTEQQATGLPGIGRGVELLSGVASQLQPLLFEGLFTKDKPNKVLDTPPLLIDPAPGWHGLDAWIAAVVQSLVWYGDAFAYRGPEVADYRGYPLSLPLLDPCRMSWGYDQDGNRAFVYQTQHGQEEFEPGSILHFVTGARAGCRMGQGILDRYQQELKLLLMTEKQQTVLMQNGKPMGVVGLTQDVTPGEAGEFKTAIMKAFREDGLAVTGGAKFESLSWSSSDLAMVPAREFNLRMASEIVGIPPYLLGVPSESRVYSNMETEWASFLRTSLGRYLQAMESGLTTCFPRDRYVRFNVDQLLRSDAAARWSVYQTATGMGAMTVDEVRQAEGLAPLSGGTVPDSNAGPEQDPDDSPQEAVA